MARREARFCDACGKELPARGVSPVSVPPDLEEIEGRFAALVDHPDFRRWMEHTPPPSTEGPTLFRSALGIMLLALVGLVVTVATFSVCAPLGFLPLALVVVGVLALSRQASRSKEARNAPLVRTPALFVDERAKLGEGAEGGPARTEYHATLLHRDGSTVELRVLPELAGRLEKGEMGIAFCEDQVLVEFGRIPV